MASSTGSCAFRSELIAELALPRPTSCTAFAMTHNDSAMVGLLDLNARVA